MQTGCAKSGSKRVEKDSETACNQYQQVMNPWTERRSVDIYLNLLRTSFCLVYFFRLFCSQVYLFLVLAIYNFPDTFKVFVVNFYVISTENLALDL